MHYTYTTKPSYRLQEFVFQLEYKLCENSLTLGDIRHICIYSQYKYNNILGL